MMMRLLLFSVLVILSMSTAVGTAIAADPTVGISATSDRVCVGDTTTINVEFTDISNLYGYEFKLSYSTTGFTAQAGFDNTWFDTTTNAFVVSGWNATDTGGIIQFATTKLAPAVPVTGSGSVATIELTGLTVGTYDITISDIILSDNDGNRINALVSPDKVTVEVCKPLAVTLAGFLAARISDTVEFRWQMATETGTAGFNLYAESDGERVLLNAEMIPSEVIESITPTNYNYSIASHATIFYLEEIGIDGLATLHGPFDLGVQYGAYLQPGNVDRTMPLYLPLMVR